MKSIFAPMSTGLKRATITERHLFHCETLPSGRELAVLLVIDHSSGTLCIGEASDGL